ncbi:MAG: SH3-like domain-containing protein [Halobacteriota archaeon]
MPTSHTHSHSNSHDEVDVELAEEPRFDPGTRVQLTEAVLEKYKRRPAYAEGAEGVIEQVRGAYLPPTAIDETDGEYLYSVRFLPQDLWEGHPEENGSIYIDLWEKAIETV